MNGADVPLLFVGRNPFEPFNRWVWTTKPDNVAGTMASRELAAMNPELQTLAGLEARPAAGVTVKVNLHPQPMGIAAMTFVVEPKSPDDPVREGSLDAHLELASLQAGIGRPDRISYSLVATGRSSGDAFRLRVVDPSGRLRSVRAPEGLILEPLESGGPAPADPGPGGKVLTYEVTAFCVDYQKVPPAENQFYRVAPPEVQAQYRRVAPVIRKGRELAAAGRFHPDSAEPAYDLSIEQYAGWAEYGDWNEAKFTEVFVEKTRENAEVANVKWTKPMEETVRKLAHGRWLDVQLVRESARAPDNPSAQSPK
jgi:hypothetical protein